MAEIADVVRVITSISAGGTPTREFGRTLYLTAVDTEETAQAEAQLIRGVGIYASASALSATNPSAALNEAGEIYFQQDPYPKNLLVGSIIRIAQPNLIYGFGPVDVADVEVLGDNVALQIGAEDFTADFDGVATRRRYCGGSANRREQRGKYRGRYGYGKR